jgi:5-methylcytosine-specific restriction enzyme B
MAILAERIRTHANTAFIAPARRAGRTEVTIVAGDVHKDMKLLSRMPAVCAALDTQKFQEDYDVVLSSRSGPAQSSTATWRFSLRKS